jgi:hypothetical protein
MLMAIGDTMVTVGGIIMATTITTTIILNRK